MHFLITGGAGFIGSHLSDYILHRGHFVTIIDNLSTATQFNIAHLVHHPRFECVFRSIFDRPLLDELIDRADVVIHLAAVVGVKLVMERPVHTIETNVNGTEVVLKAAAKTSKKVVIASTSEVYGKSMTVPFREDDDIVLGPTVRNRWSYACSKALDEFLALAYYQQGKTPIVIVRLFNTTGPRQTGRYGMVVPRFVQQALRGEPICIYGTGTQTRCFAHVTDVVSGMYKLSLEPAAVGGVFNLGNDKEVSINELAAIVREVTGCRSQVSHIEYGEAYPSGYEDMQRRVPSLEKAERLVGYRPTLDLRQIVESVVEYFAQNSRADLLSLPA
jgi:UDP-glucose 4-epimerase